MSADVPPCRTVPGEVTAGPLITLEVHERLRAALQRGSPSVDCSLDLERSRTTVTVDADGWNWQGRSFPWLSRCKARTVYFWEASSFEPAARYAGALIKLVPTGWGPPTFEIDGIKMLPTAKLSPIEDAARKVSLVEPGGRRILDTCGGLGYFAGCCMDGGAALVQSYEKNPDVVWLRGLNPWSPAPGGALQLVQGDILAHIGTLADRSFDAVLHDPPRFGIAGELYSRDFYRQLARVLRPGGRMFHYTGAPNRLTSGRDVPKEVAQRLRAVGFEAVLHGDGVLATRR